MTPTKAVTTIASCLLIFAVISTIVLETWAIFALHQPFSACDYASGLGALLGLALAGTGAHTALTNYRGYIPPV